MIYIYESKNETIQPIDSSNFKNGIILIEDGVKLEKKQNKEIEEVKNIKTIKNIKNIKHIKTVKNILNMEINFKSFNRYTVSKKYENYKLEAEFSLDTIKEFIKTIGLLDLVKLKNEIYDLDDFFTKKSRNNDKVIIFKNRGIFKIFSKDKIYFTDSIYRFSKYELWKHEDDYEIIFFNIGGDYDGEF